MKWYSSGNMCMNNLDVIMVRDSYLPVMRPSLILEQSQGWTGTRLSPETGTTFAGSVHVRTLGCFSSPNRFNSDIKQAGADNCQCVWDSTASKPWLGEPDPFIRKYER